MPTFVPWDSCTTPEGVAKLECISIVFQNIVLAALLFAGVVALVLIIHAGFKFVISSGDPKKVADSRNTIVYAILGLFIVLLAFLILNLVGYITGVTCILNFGFGACV